MPDAATYEEAAGRFRSLGELLLREAGSLRTWQRVPFVGEGPVRACVDRSIDTTHGHLLRAVDELRRLAVVCDARAVVCREYRRAVERHRSLPVTERLVTPRPPRPASWVDL